MGSKFATILVFGGPKGFQEGVRKKHEKRCEKKAAGDAGDAGDAENWGGVPYSRSAECRPQTSKPRSRTPATGRPKLRLATTPLRALRHGGGFFL